MAAPRDAVDGGVAQGEIPAGRYSGRIRAYEGPFNYTLTLDAAAP